ncbi:hypothetical protein [Hathewaya histolytica]|nr:hypothetical protein [Hathewaya histolytica]
MKNKILKKFLLDSLPMSITFILGNLGLVWIYTDDFNTPNTRVIKVFLPTFYVISLGYFVPLLLRFLRTLLDMILRKSIKNVFTIIDKDRDIEYDYFKKSVYASITATDSKGKRKKFLLDESMSVLNYHQNNKVIIEYFKFSGVVTSIERAPK